MAHLIDKDAALAKIDSEIKLLEPYLGACAGQIVAEANSKIAAYNQVKDILNTLEVKEVDLEKPYGGVKVQTSYRGKYNCDRQFEEPVNDNFTIALAECIHHAQGSVVDPMAHAEIWKDELIKLAKSEEPVSEDLENAALEYATHYDKNWSEVKDGYIAENEIEAFKAGAKWQKTKDESTTEDLGEYINELSKQFPEVSFAKLSRIAVRVAKWQKEQFEKKY